MNVLAKFLIIYVVTIDFCSAQPRITINEYAVKDKSITITCEDTRPSILFVSLLSKGKDNQEPTIYELHERHGERVNTRAFTLLSDPNSVTPMRLNLTKVKCTDAQGYACQIYSDDANAQPGLQRTGYKILKVIDLSSELRLSLTGNDPCPGTIDECDKCRPDNMRTTLDARKVGETFRIECSSTVPAVGKSTFRWFYRDGQGEYRLISENVTNSSPRITPTSSPDDGMERCINGNRMTSRLDFTPNPQQDYGTNLVIRCNMTYNPPRSSKAVEKTAETEICLIGDRVVSSTESSTAKVGQSGSGGLGAGGIAGIVIAVIAVIVLVVILVYFLVYKKKSGAGKKPKSTPRDYKPEPDNYDDNDPNSRRGVDNDAMAMDGEKPPPPQKQTGRQGRENRPIGMDQTPPEHNIYRRSGDYDGNGFNQPQGSAV